MFKLGEQMAAGGGLLSAMSLITNAIGMRIGDIPKKTSSAAYGRVQAIRAARWIGLVVAVVGLTLMVVGSV